MKLVPRGKTVPDIDTLHNKYVGRTCYIIGTGPSMYTFPKSFLDQLADRELCIGLNQAWKYLSTGKFTYNLSIHPDIVEEAKHLEWITKYKYPERHNLPWYNYYIFKSNQDLKQKVNDLYLIHNKRTGFLYVGRGIHTTGMVLAAQMGCKHIVLIGVDCNEIDGIHHGHDQAVQFHGHSSQTVYREYYENAVLVRKTIYEKYKAYVISMNSFVGYNREEEELLRLKELYQLPALPPAVDVSKYDRKKVDRFQI